MFWSDPAAQFFAGNRRPTGLPNTANFGTEIQQKLPKDPVNKPPYFVSCFDQDENTAFYSAYKVTPVQAGDLRKYSRGSINQSWRNTGISGESFRKALLKQTRKKLRKASS